ncbi:microtubule-associated protein 10-like [Lytechinus variegatus]|uniref:microtubule-associated protein 10-like n=1 Tax=Lytechinus variegatus TaxID=7654 RepID=UPI001BB17E63|nr:microtubule-associated protein 10-like [Lytechinus variegatus]
MDDNNISETLFSLELAVNSLRIDPRTVICRMPAVAFRLLDFPSIMVEQLDETEARLLKSAIHTSWEYEENIPPQLDELKTRHGNHEFKKGKSSLYKYRLSSLVSHLDNTPLYIMIVDVWNNTPKLVAHCNVSLKEVVHRIKKDVSDFGVSVPSVHGIQGKFPLVNLMGTEIGWISLGIRLLSLGGNLIPHIADASLMKNKEANLTKDHEDATTVPKTSADQQEKPQVQGSTPVYVPSSRPACEHCDHQRNEDLLNGAVKVDLACQTIEGTDEGTRADMAPSTKIKKRPMLTSSGVSSDNIPREDGGEITIPAFGNNDLCITNIHVPPPLIYSSENDVKSKATDGRRQRVPQQNFKHQSFPSPLGNRRNATTQESCSSAFSSDMDNKKELEVQYVIHPPEYNSSPNVRKILRNKRKKKSIEEPVDVDPSLHFNPQRVKEPTRPESEIKGKDISDRVEDLQKLPILQALLRELSILNRIGTDKSKDSKPMFVKEDLESQKSSSKHFVDQRTSGRKSEFHVIENEPKVVPAAQKSYRHKHRECAKPPEGVPASKSFLRQQPRYGKHRKGNKLKFKMTNSQKLRIQKHNPEAFRQLEEEERIAEIEFQMQAAARMHKESKRRPAAPHPSEDVLLSLDANISTEIAKHCEQGQSDNEDSNTIFKRGMETFKIPTSDIVDDDMDQPLDSRDAANSVAEKDASDSEKSARSISVHLPTALVQNDDEEEENSSEDESQEEGPKHLSVPGFPEGPQEDERPLEPVTPIQPYSDDFEDSYRCVSTGEQELANIQSSIASETSSVRQDYPATDSDHSNSGSYKTAESVPSVRSPGAVTSQPSKVANPADVVNPPSKSSSSSTSSKYPPSVLSIPQPQMSANSPIPLARRSVAKSTISSQPPQPKPRLSLDHSSSLSNVSVLVPELSNTFESSEVNTFEGKPEVSDGEGQDNVYSDDFYSDD